METYYISIAEDNFALTECSSLARAYYLATRYSCQWELPVAISIMVDGQLEDLDVIEPDFSIY